MKISDFDCADYTAILKRKAVLIKNGFSKNPEKSRVLPFVKKIGFRLKALKKFILTCIDTNLSLCYIFNQQRCTELFYKVCASLLFLYRCYQL